MARNKIKAADYPVDSHCKAGLAVFQIGELQRQIKAGSDELAAATAALKLAAEAQAAPLKAELKGRLTGLQGWADSNRESLTSGGKVKSFQLAGGKAGWRMDPDSIALKGVDAILARIRKGKKFAAFLRVKFEIDKEAMLKDEASKTLARKLDGVSVVQNEKFWAEPAGLNLADDGKREG